MLIIEESRFPIELDEMPNKDGLLVTNFNLAFSQF